MPKRTNTSLKNTSLEKYVEKRTFTSTPEPKGSVKDKRVDEQLRFVIQKHRASHLHYDFRLELEGTLKSWAVPKGPSLDPEVKRLAMMVEDHPIDYMTFEGTIPKGNYGAGTVIVWDIGVYHSSETLDPEENIKKLVAGYHKGHMNFVLYGKKLKGAFSLIKIKNAKDAKNENAWLLVKQKDEYARNDGPELDDVSALSDMKDITSDSMPHHIAPMLATLTREPFDKKGWIFEIKWDGYRAIAECNNKSAHKKVLLYSRNGNSFVEKYPIIVDALKAIPHDVVFDGEIVATKDGKPDFHTLQNYEKSTPLNYVVFDVLYLDGKDLRDMPLVERKRRLEAIVPKAGVVIVSEHIEEKGNAFFKEIQKKHLEGIVAKDGQSAYLEGKRGESWLKIKNINEQEAIILGYTKPRGSRKNLGALVLGAYEESSLKYIGHSGGGFTEKELKDLYEKLSKITIDASPLKEKVPINSPITWVKPHYVCEIEFTEWTPEGRMRHPIFIGIREDKKPKDVHIEKVEESKEIVEKEEAVNKNTDNEDTAIENTASEDTPIEDAVIKNNTSITQPLSELKLTHLDKIYWPKDNYTKGDLLEYYKRMAPLLLPYLKDRPESLLRHPNGIQGKSFFQKDMENQVPDFVRTEKIWSESNNAEINYVICDNEETLLYLANLGCIELNPWNSRMAHLDNPDYMIIDLDPGDTTFKDLIKVAHTVHEVLNEACEEHYIKTSGKRGLHVMIPLGAAYTYETVRTFSELLVTIIHTRLPEITSLERSPAKRKNKIYLDYLQNRRGQTLAAPYSLRPWPKAPVSTPLQWDEVNEKLDPSSFTIKTIFERLEKVGDLWKPMLTSKVDLNASIKCLEEHKNKTLQQNLKPRTHSKPRPHLKIQEPARKKKKK